jgi:hypothetical protein
MSKKTSSRQAAIRVKRPRRQFVISVGVVLSLFAGWTLLAYSGALDPIFKQKRKPSGAVSIQSFNSNSPSKEYIYAGGRLVATEEPASSGCGTPPPTPGNLVATAQSTTSVLLNWAFSPGAHYEVQRRQSIAPGTDWATLSPNPGSNTFTDNGVVANTAYLY